MKAKIVVPILASLLLIELVSAWAVPAWVRGQIRRRRRRNDETPNCNNYVNGRCKFGTCFVRDRNYPDAAANFTNEYFEEEYYCLCDAGYETYYETPADNDTFVAAKIPSEADDWCNTQMDPCRVEGDEPNVCQRKSRDSTCIHQGPNQFECICTKFWSGQICQTDVDECAACGQDATGCPCKNGAQCRNMEESEQYPFGFKCYCDPGTSGQYCETISDPCRRGPCLARAQFGGAKDENACRVLENTELSISDPTTLKGYECSCDLQWSGANCELKEGSCNSNPCGVRGQCITDQNYPSFYKCLCFTGYEHEEGALRGPDGQYCTKITDLCLSSPCRNNATCMMIAANERKCVCRPQWEGPNCESRKDPCYSPGKPKCFYGGICNRVGISGTEYSCNCTDTGYRGDLCQTNVNECLESRCNEAGAAQCIDTDGKFKCLCNRGYINTDQDETCATVESLCNADPDICQYGGLCNSTNDIDNNFACGCKQYGADNETILNGIVDELRCLTPTAPTQIEKLNLEFERDAASPVPGAVYLTRSGGIFDNPYLKLTQGYFAVSSLKDFFGKNKWFLLFFKSPALIQGNLMTVHNGNETVFEIAPSGCRHFFVLKFLTTNSMEAIVLPRHSSNSWNSLLVEGTADGVVVMLNQLKSTPRTLSPLPSFGSGNITFGSAWDFTGSYFSGGIADLFYGPSSVLSSGIVKEMTKWPAPSCKNVMDLAFNTKDPYRDEGCMHLDPVPVGEEAFAETVNATNGIFPLVSFGPHLCPNENMKRYVETRPTAQIIVRQFPILFDTKPKAGRVGMMFRFRPTYQALRAGNFTFLRSGNVLQAGTLWANNEFRFFLHLETESDDKKMEAILHVNATDSVFCEACVWSVAVNWELAPGNGTVPDNLRIYTNFNNDVRETIHTFTGVILREAVTPLVIGGDRVHQIGRTMFWRGVGLSDEERNNFVLNKDAKF